MSKRSYCTLADVKNSLGISATTDDNVLIKVTEAATWEIERYTGRTFQPEYRTKYFTGATRLWLSPDLLTVSTLKVDEDGDGTFESTLSTGDYILFPLNEFPKTSIEISDDSDYGGFANGIKKGVEIVGEWGYGDGESASCFVPDTTLGASVSVGATASVTSATNISPGLTIRIDSEQAYVQSVSGTAVTLDRGVNGTTAAVHANATQVYLYQYPPDIRQACIDLAGAIYQMRDKKGINSERIGDYSYTVDKTYVNSLLGDSIRTYRKLGF